MAFCSPPVPVIELPDDFRDILLELADAGAEFVVLGGHAVAFHGHPRATKDLDVLVRATPANAARVYRDGFVSRGPLASRGRRSRVEALTHRRLALPDEHDRKREVEMSKLLKCDALVPGCAFEARGPEDEILAAAEKHADAADELG